VQSSSLQIVERNMANETILTKHPQGKSKRARQTGKANGQGKWARQTNKATDKATSKATDKLNWQTVRGNGLMDAAHRGLTPKAFANFSPRFEEREPWDAHQFHY